MALDVIDISAEGHAAYVVPQSRTGRPRADWRRRYRIMDSVELTQSAV